MLGTGTFGRVIECRSGQDYYAVKVCNILQRSSNQFKNISIPQKHKEI